MTVRESEQRDGGATGNAGLFNSTSPCRSGEGSNPWRVAESAAALYCCTTPSSGASIAFSAFSSSTTADAFQPGWLPSRSQRIEGTATAI